MGWTPKVIEGGKSEEPNQDKAPRRKEVPASQAFVLGQGGFAPVNQEMGDAMWDFLDLGPKK